MLVAERFVPIGFAHVNNSFFYAFWAIDIPQKGLVLIDKVYPTIALKIHYHIVSIGFATLDFPVLDF